MIAAGGAACLPETPEGAGEPDGDLARTEDAVLDAGSDAGPIPNDTYPWLVNVSGCGGALVASNVVVTAAHCVDWNYPQYEDGFDDIPFSGMADVRVFGANLGDVPAGTPPRNNLWTRIRDLDGAGPAIAHPWFGGGEEGSDLAVIVYPVETAVPRHLLKPLRVAKYPIDPVTNVSLLLSPTRHQLVDDECVTGTGGETFLRSSSVTGEVDGESRSYFTWRRHLQRRRCLPGRRHTGPLRERQPRGGGRVDRGSPARRLRSGPDPEGRGRPLPLDVGAPSVGADDVLQGGDLDPERRPRHAAAPDVAQQDGWRGR